MSRKEEFIHHSSGVTEFHGADFKEIYYPWGHPKGFVVDGIQRNSQGYLRPCCLPHILERRPPFEVIHDSIPKPILKAVSNFGDGHYGLIRLCRFHEIEAIRLIVLNPLLALALSMQEDEDTAAEMVLKSWRDIARFCGYGGKADARLMAKFTKDQVHHDTLSELADIEDKRRKKLLSYLPRITYDAWLMVQELPLEVLSVEQLTYAAHNLKGTNHRDAIATLIMLRRALLLPLWPYPAMPIGKLMERSIGLRREAHRRDAIPKTIFPPPPFPPVDDYIPVADSHDLIYVAVRFECCAEGYHDVMKKGHASIWWNESGAEPHVVLLLRFLGVWRVEQVRGVGNMPVSEVTEEHVKKLFHGRKS